MRAWYQRCIVYCAARVSAATGGETSEKKHLGSAASWRSVARPSSYRRRGSLTAKEVTSHDISRQIYRSSKTDISDNESGDLEGIYKDITRNTVYVVEWRRARAGGPFLSFSLKFKRVVQIVKKN